MRVQAYYTEKLTNICCRKFCSMCAVCHKSIVPKKGQTKVPRLRAMGKDFHLDCFKCEVGVFIQMTLFPKQTYKVMQFLKTCMCFVGNNFDKKSNSNYTCYRVRQNGKGKNLPCRKHNIICEQPFILLI